MLLLHWWSIHLYVRRWSEMCCWTCLCSPAQYSYSAWIKSSGTSVCCCSSGPYQLLHGKENLHWQVTREPDCWTNRHSSPRFTSHCCGYEVKLVVMCDTMCLYVQPFVCLWYFTDTNCSWLIIDWLGSRKRQAVVLLCHFLPQADVFYVLDGSQMNLPFWVIVKSVLFLGLIMPQLVCLTGSFTLLLFIPVFQPLILQLYNWNPTWRL